MNFFTYFRRLIIPVLFTSLLIVAACKESPTDISKQGNYVHGVLLDEQNNSVPNAVMEVLPSAGIQSIIAIDTTDEDGIYKLEGLPEDLTNLDVNIKHSDFKPMKTNLKKLVGTNDKNDLKVKMLHEDSCCGVVEFNVFTEDGNEPIPNAEIRLKRNNDLVRKALTNENGKRVFENVCPATYNYRIAKEGFNVLEGELEVVSCDSAERVIKNLYMKRFNDSCCKGVIVFTAIDSATNAVIVNLPVRLWKGDSKLGEFKTNEQGQVIFTHICEGEYAISASSELYKGIEFGFNIGCNDTVNFTKYFKKAENNNNDSCCKGVIIIIPKNKITGEILNGSLVKMYKNGSLLTKKYTEGGSAKFINVCPGEYGFDITKDGFKSIEFSIKMECNDTITTDKQLEPMPNADSCCNGVIIFRAYDSTTRAAIVNLLTRLWKGSTKLSEYKTNEQGTVTFTKICPGTYQISASNDMYKGKEFNFTMGCNDTLVFEKLFLKNNGEDKDSCCNGTITFTAIDSVNNTPVPMLPIRLWKGSSKLSEIKTNESGQVVFSKICEGDYQISASSDAYKGQEFNFHVGCNENVSYTKNFIKNTNGENDSCCNGKVTFAPVDETTNELLSGAVVKISKNGKLLEAKTVGDAPVVFTKLCNTTYNFLI
ncbi:MAG: hypothetical protein WCT77_13030, partial [Bacteroidota bacterium]